MRSLRALRRIPRRDPRLTVGGFFALVAAVALAAGLSQRGPAGLDVAGTPRPPAQVSTGASPLPAVSATAAATGTPAPAPTSTSAPGELAAARTAPGHTAATAGPTANPWIEATPPPDTPAPPTPTPSQGRCNVSMSGTCEFPPPTP